MPLAASSWRLPHTACLCAHSATPKPPGGGDSAAGVREGRAWRVRHRRLRRQRNGASHPLRAGGRPGGGAGGPPSLPACAARWPTGGARRPGRWRRRLRRRSWGRPGPSSTVSEDAGGVSASGQRDGCTARRPRASLSGAGAGAAGRRAAVSRCTFPLCLSLSLLSRNTRTARPLFRRPPVLRVLESSRGVVYKSHFQFESSYCCG